MLKARAAVRALHEYRPPLADRQGLRLDFNENTVGPSSRVLQKLRELGPDALARYPERAPVERRVAALLGMRPEEVLLTNGVDEGIQLLCQTYLAAGDEAVVVVPTFAMYELFAASTGAQVIPVLAQSNFAFPADDLLAAIRPSTRIIAIANPNNPTGSVASRESLLKIVQAAPNTAILIDEAYFDFYGESVIAEVQKFPNLFVARTFSKAYGMAGLRVGILAGAAEQIAMVRRIASPYNVNAAALACLPVAFEDQVFVASYVERVRDGRTRLEAALRSLGITHWPSQANFILAKIGAQAREFVAEMATRGILVRDRSHDPGCAGCVRITIGTSPQMDQLLPILEGAVGALALAERSLA